MSTARYLVLVAVLALADATLLYLVVTRWDLAAAERGRHVRLNGDVVFAYD